MSSTQKKINDLLDRLNQEKNPHSPQMSSTGGGGMPPSNRPNLSCKSKIAHFRKDV